MLNREEVAVVSKSVAADIDLLRETIEELRPDAEMGRAVMAFMTNNPPPVTPIYGSAVSFVAYLLDCGQASEPTRKWAATLIDTIERWKPVQKGVDK